MEFRISDVQKEDYSGCIDLKLWRGGYWNVPAEDTYRRMRLSQKAWNPDQLRLFNTRSGSYLLL